MTVHSLIPDFTQYRERPMPPRERRALDARGRVPSQGDPVIRIRLLIAVVSVLLAGTVASVARSGTGYGHVPPSFVVQALCVHSGWHYTQHRVRHERPDYVLWGHGFWRMWDVPDSIPGGSGEGSWTGVVGSEYGGGMSFMVGTWRRAGGYARSTSDIAHASPAEQIYRAYRIVVGQDNGSWREWPQTSRACGY